MAQVIKNADIAIIGTGPAGISAAITAKIRNKEILLFGGEPVSSKVAKAHQILNYPGLPFRERSWHRHIKDTLTNCRLRLRKKEFMPFMQWAVTLPFRQDRSSTGQTA